MKNAGTSPKRAYPASVLRTFVQIGLLRSPTSDTLGTLSAHCRQGKEVLDIYSRRHLHKILAKVARECNYEPCSNRA